MRCLVTGGTGLVGSNLTRHLVQAGHDVIISGHEAEQTLSDFTGKCLFPGLLGIDWEAIGEIDVLFHQTALNGTRIRDRRGDASGEFRSLQKALSICDAAGMPADCLCFIHRSVWPVPGPI